MNAVHVHVPVPVAFEKSILSKPIGVKVLGKNIVLWRNQKGITAAPNMCPHRGARLSEGNIVNGDLECPYHGWRFDGSGTCKHIPQQAMGFIPKACNLNNYPTFVHNGVVWMGVRHEQEQQNTLRMKNFNTDLFLTTEYSFDAPFNYFLQVENLLDPAHLDFVHDGFQGSRDRASPIRLKFKKVTDSEISGYFTHDHPDTPDLYIRFIKPCVVDVSIIVQKTVVRKNIIYVAPNDGTSCRVLFTDVAMKKRLTSNNILQSHLNLLLELVPQNVTHEHNQLFTKVFIENIMQQDVLALSGQQENIGPGKKNYLAHKYVMPCECDQLIIEFRKWCASVDCPFT